MEHRHGLTYVERVRTDLICTTVTAGFPVFPGQVIVGATLAVRRLCDHA